MLERAAKSHADAKDKSDDEEESGSEAETAAPPPPQEEGPSLPPLTNPDSYWGTNQRRRVLRECTKTFLGIALGIRPWRHSYLAIHRNLSTLKANQEYLDYIYYS